MAEQPAVEAGAHQPEAPIVITEQMVSDMSRAGDIDGLRKLSEQLERNPADTAAAAPSTAPDAPAAGASAAQTKKWEARRRGQVVTHDDPDSYLGYGKFNVLKSKHVELLEDKKELEAEIAKARQYGDATAAELRAAREQSANLKKEYDAAIAEAKKVQAAGAAPIAAGTASPAASAAPTAPTGPVEPKYPEGLSDDPLEWTPDNWRQYNQYNKSLIQYGIEVAAAKLTPQSAALPPEFNDMKNRLDTYEKERTERLERDRQREQSDLQERSNRDLWDGFRTFQRGHADFNTKEDIQKLDGEVKSWMDKVAKANGIECPYGADANQRALYEQARSNIVGQFNQNAPAVVAKCEGIEVPDGKDQYFNLAKLYIRRQQLIQEGMITDKAPLHVVWLYDQDASGDLDRQIEAVEKDALGRGQHSVLESMSQAQQEFAQHPPAHSAGSPTTKIDPKRAGEVLRKASTTKGMEEIKADPEQFKEFELVKASLPPGMF